MIFTVSRELMKRLLVGGALCSTTRQLTWVHILPAGVTTNIRLFLDLVEHGCLYK